MLTFEECNTTFESLDVRSLFSYIQYRMGIQIKFAFEGHRVKVKVTGAKKGENANVKLPSSIHLVL